MNIWWWQYRSPKGMRNKPKIIMGRLPTRRETMSWILYWAQREFHYGARPSKRRVRREIGRLKGKR